MNNELDFENNKPQISFESSNNDLEFQAPQNVVGGGTNYKALSNKPKINGIELVDNTTLEELGIKQEYTANDITFEDGTTFQDKYNSGELNGTNGKDGYTPVKGIDYFDGKDGKNGTNGTNGATPTLKTGTTLTGNAGTSASVTMSQSGTTYTLNFTIPRGADGKNGTNGTNGKDGVDGKTPVKGTDYYTEADKREMVNLVIATLPSSEGVSY